MTSSVAAAPIRIPSANGCGPAIGCPFLFALPFAIEFGMGAGVTLSAPMLRNALGENRGSTLTKRFSGETLAP